MIGDEGPYIDDSGRVWVPRTLPYLEARRVAKVAMWDDGDRLRYVGKTDADLLGFTRDCRCEEVCELAQRCARCDHDHGDYDGACWFDGCACQKHLRPPYGGPCRVPAWAFQIEDRYATHPSKEETVVEP